MGGRECLDLVHRWSNLAAGKCSAYAVQVPQGVSFSPVEGSRRVWARIIRTLQRFGGRLEKAPISGSLPENVRFGKRAPYFCEASTSPRDFGSPTLTCPSGTFVRNNP